MAELTKEYFDEKITTLTTHIDEQIDELGRMTNTGLEEIKQQLDVRQEMEVPKRDMLKTKQVLHLS